MTLVLKEVRPQDSGSLCGLVIGLSGYRLPGWLSNKESASKAGDLGLIPGLGRSSGERNRYRLQYSCLENPMDRGAWWVWSPKTEEYKASDLDPVMGSII